MTVGPEPEYILHIAEIEDWEASKETGSYAPASFEEEGFVHASLAGQIPGVLQRYYPDRSGLVLLAIQISELDAPVRWEDLTGSGERFPHIYGRIPVQAVRAVDAISHASGEIFVLPASIRMLVSEP